VTPSELLIAYAIIGRMRINLQKEQRRLMLEAGWKVETVLRPKDERRKAAGLRVRGRELWEDPETGRKRFRADSFVTHRSRIQRGVPVSNKLLDRAYG